ncbi:MAG: YggT family protein [Actinobacteria bacterium]|nr:YggT family protein [Actinomycetota bacterium]MBW3648567.1 YggT family protein [Actinomycetota bacterium]
MVAFAISVAGAIAQIVLGFYGFWLIWRVLLPYLPGPDNSGERVAPFVGYFTDPFINPVARRLHLPARAVAGLSVVIVAAASVLVRRATSI